MYIYSAESVKYMHLPNFSEINFVTTHKDKRVVALVL